MYAQFFGAYLLNHDAVSSEQLIDAIRKLSDTRLKLGTLAMHEGLMTAGEVDEVCFIQTREDKRFGEIAIERGLLTPEQAEALLQSQTPDYLLLGQNLVDNGALTNSDLERLINDYQNDTEIFDMGVENVEGTAELIQKFFTLVDQEISPHTVAYLRLLFNDLIRFLGSDFTPLSPVKVDEVPISFCITQEVTGPMHIISRLEMSEEVALSFASRYAKMEFPEFDEYVSASLEDFLNLHNGLFSVNMSNNESMELSLEPPYAEEEDIALPVPKNTFVVPVIFPFGTIQFILTFE